MWNAKTLYALSAVAGLLGGMISSPEQDPPKVDPVASEPTLEGAGVSQWMSEVKVRNVPAGSAVVWDVVPEGNVTVRTVKSERAILFAGPAGTYTVKCRVVKGEDVVADLRKTVMLAHQAPDPVPPTPTPPDPTPGGKPAKFVVVEDTSKAGQWRGDVLASPKVQAYYRAAKLTHLVIPLRAAEENPPPEVATYLGLAKNKPLPYAWVLDSDARLVKEGQAPVDPDKFVAFIGGDGTKREMGNLPPEEGRLKLKWKVFGEHANVPIIPRADWKTINLSAFLPPVYDQDGRGQCNASATCTAVEACRNVAGLTPVHLSAGDLYSQINGGRDQGSLLEDGLDAATTSGVATAASVKYVWDGRRYDTPQVKAERAQYRVIEAYVCPNFDAMASALQQGFFVVEGLVWYDNDVPDRDGWIPAVGRGGAGGHALCGYGLAKKGDGTWGIRTRNSWGAGWGLGGDCVIPEKRFDQRIGGFWAVRSALITPTNFPVPRVATRERTLGFDFALKW